MAISMARHRAMKIPDWFLSSASRAGTGSRQFSIISLEPMEAGLQPDCYSVRADSTGQPLVEGITGRGCFLKSCLNRREGNPFQRVLSLVINRSVFGLLWTDCQRRDRNTIRVSPGTLGIVSF